MGSRDTDGLTKQIKVMTTSMALTADGKMDLASHIGSFSDGGAVAQLLKI